jgi:hypothetical protein
MFLKNLLLLPEFPLACRGKCLKDKGVKSNQFTDNKHILYV